MVEPITRRFVESIDRYAQDNQIPMVTFAKGQRKDDIANQRRVSFAQDEGVVFIGKGKRNAPSIAPRNVMIRERIKATHGS
jgi:hypothetical protein